MIEGHLDTVHVDCVVVGGGIAGCWAAIKLCEQNIKTALIFYSGADRGGKLGATSLSAGAINTSPLTRTDYKSWVEEMGRGQVHSNVCQITQDLLEEELESLKKYDALKSINLGVALKSGSGRHLTKALLTELKEKGVTVIEQGWVVKLNASEQECNGLQYQVGNKIGSIVAGSMIIASGGYSSLFHGAVKTGTYGSIHGRFLEAGGYLSNTEFVFKHGYGQPDLGKLTPTEELPGAEIYDEDGQHLRWLEEELFYGRGTNNHFQAFMTWRKNGTKKYFVDFRYRDFNRALKSKLAEIEQSSDTQKQTKIDELVNYTIEQSNAGKEFKVKTIINALINKELEYNYETFNEIKDLVSEAFKADKNRIRQISYFSMGGIMHHRFKTNLKNVYVTGEAMHDYGAHRVGGLPWALYLCSARVIATEIANLKSNGRLTPTEFPLIEKLASFDKEKLETIQLNLQKYQENGLEDTSGMSFIRWLRRERAQLQEEERTLDDIMAYLLVAEAIMTSSLERCESRGSFFRQDFTEENYDFRNYRSITVLSEENNAVVSCLVDKSRILNLVTSKGSGYKKLATATEKENAVFALLKKHKDTHVWKQVAVETRDEQYTYEELNALVEGYAYYLFSSGITKGDRVALLLNDGPNLIALFLACLQIGVIAVPLNTFCKDDDLIHFLNDSGAKLLISENVLLNNYDLSHIGSQVSAEYVSVDDLDKDNLDRLTNCVSVDQSTPGFILYTSGSTGLPKGAVHRQSSLAKSADTFAASILALSPNDRVYSTSKIFFAYGLGNSITFPLYFGSTVLLTPEKINPEAAVNFILDKNPSVVSSVPALYKGKLDYIQQNNLTLPNSMRLALSAGEALPENLAQNWYQTTGVDLIDGIGSTEALHIFCTSNTCSENNYTNGSAVPGYEIKLLDDQGFEVGNNIVANLVVKGPTLASEYWGNPEASKNAFKNGWLKTGDRYMRNDKNEYVYIGRTGDTYKSSGLWVSALEVENCIREISIVEDAALAVFKDKDGFFKAKAYIVLSQNTDVVAIKFEDAMDHIEQHLKTHLSSYKQPHYMDFISDLPRTATGKVAKAQLREKAALECFDETVVEEAIEA